MPYRTFVSPTDSTDPFYCSGSQNLLTSIAGYAERRPGFSDTLETTPSSFTNVQRLFAWNRWDGTFIWMLCDVTASTSVVYKLVVGTDSSFGAVYTDSGSTTAFDFVASDDQCFFSNGHVAKKWDPSNGLSNWGITAPVNAPTLSTDGYYCGTAAGTNWTNPSNAQGKADQKYAVYNSTTQDYLKCTNFSIAVPSGANITGVIVNIIGHSPDTTTANRNINVGLTLDGSSLAGTEKTGQTLNLGTDSALSLGGSGDLFGNTAISVAQATSSTFGVLIRDADTTAAELDIDSVQIIPYWTATNGVDAQVGWVYVYCYGNSKTGHVSSPSPASDSTGLLGCNMSMGVSVTASTDPQVDQIHIYRTTDGGGGNYFEITGSPFSNTTQTIYDTTPDTALNINSIAPIPGFNDPPPAWQGMKYWNGRIWGFVQNKVWFTGWEEITTGVAEECVPSGADGNYWQFDEAVTGIASTQDALQIACGGRIYTITGDTLDTFRRTLFTDRRGTRYQTSIAQLGKMAVWYDTAGQYWGSDGSTLQELGQDIRPDLAGLSGNLFSAFHTSGRFHWVVFSTGSSLFVYDVDEQQWMPPWTVAATCIASGETSAGTYDLVAAIGGKVYKLNANAFNDAGSAYSWKAVTSMFNMVPDFGRRFSYIAQGIYDEPTRAGGPWYFGLERNYYAIASARVLVDDDPTASSSAWQDVSANKADIGLALLRNQGSSLVQDIYAMAGKPVGRRIAFMVTGQTADQHDKFYQFFIAYKTSGGR